jgi:hypothetical protein
MTCAISQSAEASNAALKEINDFSTARQITQKGRAKVAN